MSVEGPRFIVKETTSAEPSPVTHERTPATGGLPPGPHAARSAMAVLELVLQGIALFGVILFFVLWLMHLMSIIYV